MQRGLDITRLWHLIVATVSCCTKLLPFTAKLSDEAGENLNTNKTERQCVHKYTILKALQLNGICVYSQAKPAPTHHYSQRWLGV